MQSSTPSGTRYVYQQKQVRMNTLYGPKNGSVSQRLLPIIQPSTKDSLLKVSIGSTSDSGTHAHSDGRLHYLCHHKSCSSHKTRPSIESQMFCKQFNNASCQDLETLRKFNVMNKSHIATFDSMCIADNTSLNVDFL